MLSFHIKTPSGTKTARYVPIEDDNAFSGRIPFALPRPTSYYYYYYYYYYTASSHRKLVFKYYGFFSCFQPYTNLIKIYSIYTPCVSNNLLYNRRHRQHIYRL